MLLNVGEVLEEVEMGKVGMGEVVDLNLAW